MKKEGGLKKAAFTFTKPQSYNLIQNTLYFLWMDFPSWWCKGSMSKYLWWVWSQTVIRIRMFLIINYIAFKRSILKTFIGWDSSSHSSRNTFYTYIFVLDPYGWGSSFAKIGKLDFWQSMSTVLQGDFQRSVVCRVNKIAEPGWVLSTTVVQAFEFFQCPSDVWFPCQT